MSTPPRKRINKTNPAKSERQRAFAANLRTLIRLSGWTQKEAAEKWGLSKEQEPWLRRAATQGIGWTKKGNEAVAKIAAFYKIDPSILWESGYRAQLVAANHHLAPPPVDQLRVILAHYSGRPKPEYLLAILDGISRYFQDAKFGKDSEEGSIEYHLKLRPFLGGQAVTIQLLQKAILESAAYYNDEISDLEALTQAEDYARRDKSEEAVTDPRTGWRIACELALDYFRDVLLRKMKEPSLEHMVKSLPTPHLLEGFALQRFVTTAEGLFYAAVDQFASYYAHDNSTTEEEVYKMLADGQDQVQPAES